MNFQVPTEYTQKTLFHRKRKEQEAKMMGGRRLGESIGMKEDVIKRACHLSMKAHNSPGKQYLYEKNRGSANAVFAFSGSWSVDDWYSQKPFGATKINLDLFPSLRSIGNDETAVVNEAFFRRFEQVLTTSSLRSEVENAVTERKQVVFAGHSSGGPLAIFATLWFLEKYTRHGSNVIPRCVTFGSPLAGDRILPHALTRENWASCFIHFVMRYDIVPRVMLAPLSSIERELQPILQFFNPKSPLFQHLSVQTSNEAFAFFTTVMTNTLSVASHAACNLMGSTNSILDNLSGFIELSPYRPFGTYVFCTGNGKLVVLKNPHAVLQMLFYCSQLSYEAEQEAACRSLNEHIVYVTELQESLEMQNVIYLWPLENLPLSLESDTSDEVATTNAALNDLGLVCSA